MSFDWHQAITSALVGTAAAAVALLLMHGSLDRHQLQLAATLGLGVGASRLIELRRP